MFDKFGLYFYIHFFSFRNDNVRAIVAWKEEEIDTKEQQINKISSLYIPEKKKK